MDFSSEFARLRDRIEKNVDSVFTTKQNTPVGGRMAALMSSFKAGNERKMLGMISTGSMAYAHEYRLLFAQPVLDAQALEDWWGYALGLERTLVQPGEDHSFTLISLVLACGEIDRAAQKKIKKLSCEKQYDGGKSGWSSLRLAVVDLAGRKILTNSSGDPLKGILKPIL